MNKNVWKVVLICLVIIILSFVVIEVFIITEGNKFVDEEVDYLVILGARLYGDIPSPALLERLKSASKYLEEYDELKVVVSGGQGSDEDVSEAYAMSEYLFKTGISRDRIIIEDKSTSTFENLSFSLDRIRENDDRDKLKVMIVTNKFHILRSKMIAKRLGMEAYGLPAEIPPTIVKSSYIREYFALIKSFLFDKI